MSFVFVEAFGSEARAGSLLASISCFFLNKSVYESRFSMFFSLSSEAAHEPDML